MKPFARVASTISLMLLAACASQISTPNVNTNNTSKHVLGITTLEIGADGPRASTRTVSSDGAATFNAPLACTNSFTAGANFISCIFSVTANQAFSNLTLYALAHDTNLGGTAFNTVQNFAGTALTDESTARNIKPTHGMDAAGTALVSGQEDLQYFSPAEALAVQTTARTSGFIGTNDRVLEYGYVARNGAARAFATGNTGQVTIALKIPVVSAAADPYRFKMSYVLSDEPIARFTRSIEEGIANITAVTTRAGAVAGNREIAFVGGPNNSLNVCCKSLQMNNPLTAVSTVALTSSVYLNVITNAGGIAGLVFTPYTTAGTRAILGIPESAEFALNQAIVKFKPNINQANAVRNMASSFQTEVDAVPLFESTSVLTVGAPQTISKISASSSAADTTLQFIAQLRARSDIVYAEPNYVQYKTQSAVPPNDPLYPVQITPTNSNNIWHYTQANIPNAWTTTTGSSSVRVAVIDTGILLNKNDTNGNDTNATREATTHPDLYCPSRWRPGYNFVSYTSANTSPNQAIESDDPYDIGPISGTSYHGSHVAGTIGACTNNGTGIAGIDWNVEMQSVRVLGPLGGYSSDIVRGMRWAVGLPVLTRTPANPAGVNITNPFPADILNMSLGGSGIDQTEQDAINDINAAGKVLVVSAGNSNDNAYNYSPAGLNGVITVAALGPNSIRAYYSNFGSGVEIAAPGGDLSVVTLPKGVLSIQGCNVDGQGDVNPVTGCTTWGYADFQGTSMASPHVVGILALMNAARVANSLPKLNLQEATYYLQSTAAAFPVNSDCSLGCGAGQVDAAAAVAAAAANNATGPFLQIRYDVSGAVAGLDFGTSLTTGTLTLNNLNNTAGTFTLSTSNSALSVSSATNSIAANGTVTLNVTLNRALSSDGAFIGSINATTTSGQKTSAPVYYQIGTGSSDLGRMRLRLRTFAAGVLTTISQQVINYVPGQGYLYRFLNVPNAANYVVVADIDAAGDGTSEYYRCYPQASAGLCNGTVFSITGTVRNDDFTMATDPILTSLYSETSTP